MSEPDEIRLACIGCGAMNPVGAEVCAGCGHRFAGPAGGRIDGPPPGPAPAIEEPRVSYLPPSTNHDQSILGCLAKVIGVMIAIVATIVAFGIAFFVTCTSVNGDSQLVLSFLAGLTAAATVGGFSVWVGLVLRSGPHKSDSIRYRGGDR
jgi:hypothetical protein